MIISLSGAPGSGKSTIAQELAKLYNWPRYYIGGLRRQMAKERGLTLEEYNQLGENDPQTDKEVDEMQKELGKNEDNFIIEGRTSWYFIPHSLKIYLDVSPEIAAQRVFANLSHRNEAKNLNSWQDVLKSNQKRVKSDNLRYQKYYQIDVYNPNNYDFYLDTSHLNPQEVLAKVIAYIDKNS